MEPSDLTYKYFYGDMSGVEYEFGKQTDGAGNVVLMFEEGGHGVTFPHSMLDDVIRGLQQIKYMED